jgi:hypothetical protein
VFVHVALFTWRPGTGAQDVADAGRVLTKLCEGTPGLVGYDMGSDLGLVSGKFGTEMGLQSEKADYCVVMSFDSAESWHAYNADPAHRATVRESIGRLAARRISVQFQV